MKHPQVGEWYWGAKCPECGELAAHTHDPTRGSGETKLVKDDAGDTVLEMICPNGHKLSKAAEELMRFEWGAQ